LIRLEGVLG